jgi:salicylate hydroxylase
MPHPATTQPLRIGIIGAGISGLTNYIALSELDNVQINIYEQAQELEIGASIGLGPNGLRGLQRLGVHAALNDSVDIRNHSTWPMIYRLTQVTSKA